MLEAPDGAGIVWRPDANVNSGLWKFSFHRFSYDDWYIAQKNPVNYTTSRCNKQQTLVIIHT